MPKKYSANELTEMIKIKVASKDHPKSFLMYKGYMTLRNIVYTANAIPIRVKKRSALFMILLI